LTQLGHPTCGNGHPFPSKGPFDGTVRVWVVSGAMHSNPPVSGHGAGYLDLALPIAITPKAEALKDSPFRRPLPDQHTSRDVKQCNHCGIVHGRRLWNRDSVGSGNVGYRTFLTRICGKYIPGRFHPEKSVRETSWAKISGWNAFEEGELYLKNMTRLIEAETTALRGRQPRQLDEANGLLQDAKAIWTEDLQGFLLGLINLSGDHHEAYCGHVAAEFKRMHDTRKYKEQKTRGGTYRPARKCTKRRQKWPRRSWEICWRPTVRVAQIAWCSPPACGGTRSSGRPS